MLEGVVSRNSIRQLLLAIEQFIVSPVFSSFLVFLQKQTIFQSTINADQINVCLKNLISVNFIDFCISSFTDGICGGIEYRKVKCLLHATSGQFRIKRKLRTI